MISLSYHPLIGQPLGYYAKDWRIVHDVTFTRLAACTSKYRMSPIIWNDGRRLGTNFKYADFIGLDSDSGVFTLEMALAEFKSYKHVIGTTKNHQKQKGTEGPCDRLRVFLQLNERVDSFPLYRYICTLLAKNYNCDTNPVDGARMFGPCTPVSVQDEGRCLDVGFYRDRLWKEQEAIAAKPKKSLPVDPSLKKLRPWVRQLLITGVDKNVSRNEACYKIGIYATRDGFSQSEIVELIMNSAIPIDYTVRKEVENAVKNGVKNA